MSIAYVDLPGGPADVVLVSGFVTNVSKVDVIDTWIEFKTENEVDPIRLRPVPLEFSLYFDC